MVLYETKYSPSFIHFTFKYRYILKLQKHAYVVYMFNTDYLLSVLLEFYLYLQENAIVTPILHQ